METDKLATLPKALSSLLLNILSIICCYTLCFVHVCAPTQQLKKSEN